MTTQLNGLVSEEEAVAVMRALAMPRDKVWDGSWLADQTDERGESFRIDDLSFEHLERESFKIFDPLRGYGIRARKIGATRARQLGARQFSQTMIEVSDCVVTEAREFKSRRPVVYAKIGQALKSVNCGRGVPVNYWMDACLASAALGYRYSWLVRIRVACDRFGIGIPTDPEGAREVFRLRDLSPGKTRRAALRNWVRAHGRRKRGGDGADLVRAHLRGETRFVWHGLECELIPSQFDREKEIARKAGNV